MWKYNVFKNTIKVIIKNGIEFICATSLISILLDACPCLVSPMERFEKLLKAGKITPRENVMRDVELYFASAVMVCSRKETAMDIYEV